MRRCPIAMIVVATTVLMIGDSKTTFPFPANRPQMAALQHDKKPSATAAVAAELKRRACTRDRDTVSASSAAPAQERRRKPRMPSLRR